MNRPMISVYMILYHDLQFLDDIIARIYQHVDEIVIIDGPYTYSIELFKQYNLYYDETNKPDELSRIIAKYPKIKYRFGIFTNEEEKRILGYTTCSHDTILLVDSDEFFTIDSAKLTAFSTQREKFVGGFYIHNMNRTNIQYNKTVSKYVLFNKCRISAIDHLDYLWLVGCKTKAKIINYMDIHTMCGTIYHQTLNRNKHNNIVKFIFYTSLYSKTTNNKPQLINGYTNDVLELFTRDELLDMFYHTLLAAIGIPTIGANNICMVNDEAAADLINYSHNHDSAYFRGNYKCLKNIPAFFLVDKSLSSTLHIQFENVKSITITIYEICIGAPYITHTFNFTGTKDITLTYSASAIPILDTVIQFNCSETDDASPLFKILSIT